MSPKLLIFLFSFPSYISDARVGEWGRGGRKREEERRGGRGVGVTDLVRVLRM